MLKTYYIVVYSTSKLRKLGTIRIKMNEDCSHASNRVKEFHPTKSNAHFLLAILPATFSFQFGFTLMFRVPDSFKNYL